MLPAAPHRTAEIGTEDKEFRRRLNIGLAAGDIPKGCALTWVGDADDGHALKKARAGRRLRCLDQLYEQGWVDRFIGEFANGTVASQKVDCLVHLEGPGLVTTPLALADFAKRFNLTTLSSKSDAARRFWPFPSDLTAVTVIT